MYLYKLEVTLPDQLAYAVVAADTDEKAFQAAENHLERHFVKQPDVREIVIVEKKRLEKGAGYILETAPVQL